MRKASKPPSDWLELLAHDWFQENENTARETDLKFLNYKSYLNGKISSHLLCRLSIESTSKLDFWKLLGINDEFDKNYIISQIERFCAMYDIHSALIDEKVLHLCTDQTLEADLTGTQEAKKHNVIHASSLNEIHLELDEKLLTQDRKTVKRAIREATREEKRQKKLTQRQDRERFAQAQKEAALERAAELVRSNRVPIQITKGGTAAQAAANAAITMMGVHPIAPEETVVFHKKPRSCIVVSTAADLDKIVTHSTNLFAKYNAIAKEHNQRVTWNTVAKELGINVKVREKYARMHARALKRGFNFTTNGHLKIKENPNIFLEPLPTALNVPNSISEHEVSPNQKIQLTKQMDNTGNNDIDLSTKEYTNSVVSAHVSDHENVES